MMLSRRPCRLSSVACFVSVHNGGVAICVPDAVTHPATDAWTRFDTAFPTRYPCLHMRIIRKECEWCSGDISRRSNRKEGRQHP